ncbi:MAG: DUF5011 domain-containing protein, partial [bacterium]|nr:DUF5011 domain-containing protein [bacterium]
MGSRLRRAVLVFALVLTGLPTIAGADSGTLVITEFMASNDTTLMDGTGDFPDWVEIHNPGGSAVDLGGWALTDDDANLAKYVFPSVTLDPGAYLVVFASTPATTPPPGELHTGFGLSAGGEYLGLVESDGVTIASQYAPEYPAQSTDVSFGISSAGGLAYFTSPTPGAPNGVGQGLPVAPPTFSTERGFHDTAFDLVLTDATPDSTIFYTTDGSEPTASSTEYIAPIPVTTTTTVRAVALRDGWVDSSIETHTYIFVADVLNQPAVVAGYPNNFYSVGYGSPVQHDNEMDPAVVVAYGSEMTAAMTAIPTISIVADPGEIFGDTGFYDGEDVIKMASIEVLYQSDPAANHQAETGIESHSHDRLKRSLRLTFKTEYGDTFFDTDLFENAPLNGDTATDYIKRFVLRGGNNRAWSRVWNPDDTTFTEDEFWRSTQLALSGDGSRGVFAHLYINGIYWGLYNPVERPDEHFTSEYLGGDNDDWFFLNHGGATDGDSSRYQYLKNTLVDQDLADPAKYTEIQEYLDIDHFTDYLLSSWYQGVSDWPQNNWYYGNRTDSSSLGSTPGRFYAWDGEWSWDSVNGFPTPPNGPWVHPLFQDGEDGDGYLIAELWHALRANNEFMDRFVDRVQAVVSAGGALSDAEALARWQTLNDAISVAVVGESARWGDSLDDGTTRTRNLEWQEQVNDIADILDGSAAMLISALRAEGFFPAFDAPVFSQNGGTIDPGFDLEISNPDGSGNVYYTTDGSDPRGAGGGVGATATEYVTPIDLTATTTVNARVEDGGEWSALSSAQFVVASPLRISEMHYHALDPTADEITAGYLDSDQFDFIEVLNTGPAPVDLAGFAFTSGIDFTFPAMTLNPGDYATAVHNQAAFESRNGTGINIAGVYSGKLSNGGEDVTLVDEFGVTIHDYTYDDKDPWPETPDGDGPSLEIVDTEGNYSAPTNWQASVYAGGSPGGAPLVDVTAPVIVLVGANPQTIAQGAPYLELGATAQDDADGDISSLVMIDASTVDTGIGGQYDVTYNVSDSSGNPAAEVSRTVDVVAVGPFFEYFVDQSVATGYQWADGVPVDLTVQTPDGGGGWNPAYHSDTAASAIVSPGQTRVEFDVAGVGVTPGDLITLSGDAVTKELVVSALEISDVNDSADTVAGLAEAEIDVRVSISDGPGSQRQEITDSGGAFTADFSVVGDQSFEQNTYDITSDSAGEVATDDDDGDRTIRSFERRPPAGCTIAWDVDADGDWSDSANWLPQRVPDVSDDVCIDRSGADPTVSVDGVFEVNSLVSNEAVSMLGSTDSLTINGPSVLNDDFVTSGLLTAADLTINGSTVWSAGSWTGNFVNSGSLEFGVGDLDGTFNNTGTLRVGVVSSLNVSGNFTNSGTAYVEIADEPSTALFGQVNIGGMAVLDGTLDIELVGGFVPADGSEFDVFTWGSYSGSFTDIVDLAPHFSAADYLANALRLTASVPVDVIDFSALTLTSYENGQDAGTAEVLDGGATLRLAGNAWKKVSLPTTVEADTILAFDFSSSSQGEIQGIGFDTDNGMSPDR